MRIGIIGAGTMGRIHAECLQQIADADLVAVAAPEIPPTTRTWADQIGAECLPSANDLIERSDVDAVIVATPTPTHHDLVIAAARAGKQIMCEKPLSRTIEQGEAMLREVERAGVKLAVGHVVRYFSEYALTHDMIERGELGTIGVARCTRGAAHPNADRTWYADFEASGGVVLDMMIHDLDWLRWCFGPIERLHAQGLTFANTPGKDAAQAVLRFQSGAIGYAEASWAYPGGFRTSLEVSGSAGLIRADNQTGSPLRFELAPTETAAGVAVPTGGLIDDPYTLQLRSLLGWFAGGDAPRSTAEDALEAVRLSFAVIESVRTGRTVNWG